MSGPLNGITGYLPEAQPTPDQIFDIAIAWATQAADALDEALRQLDRISDPSSLSDTNAGRIGGLRRSADLGARMLRDALGGETT